MVLPGTINFTKLCRPLVDSYHPTVGFFFFRDHKSFQRKPRQAATACFNSVFAAGEG